MKQLTITQPDDWHLHLRDDAAMHSVVQHSARVFARAIIMPNLKPPVTDVAQALAYRQRILQALPPGSHFEPLMTLYLTDNTQPQDIIQARQSGHVKAVKLYPAGATTNSDSGVTSLDRVMPVLETLAEVGMPLLVHGEVTDQHVDIFDREKVFIDSILEPLVNKLPELKVVLEHITTEDAVAFVAGGSQQLAATITAHHLLHNRSDMLAGGIRPHLYCLPVLKREQHRQALLQAATSGNAKFFLGTDSAPHARGDKQSDCGCAGCFTAHAALELYAEAFDSVNALDRLEAFAAWFGPDFYGLPRNQGRVTLQREDWQVPADYPMGDQRVVPLRATETLCWRITEVEAVAKPAGARR